MILTPENELAIADLRFLLPLKSGAKVLLSSTYHFLERELLQIGVNFSHLEDLNNQQELNGGFDAAIFPMLQKNLLQGTIKLFQRLLKEDAVCVCGIKNAKYWLKPIKHDSDPDIFETTPKEVTPFFEQFGFSVIRQFGNPDRISNPRYLVDLSTSCPTRHYIENLQTPYTQKGAIKQILSRYWIKAFSYTTLYPSLIILAQKTSSAIGKSND